MYVLDRLMGSSYVDRSLVHATVTPRNNEVLGVCEYVSRALQADYNWHMVQ